MEIVSIAREHDLTMDLIAYAMMQKAPRQPKIAPRKSKRSSGADSTSPVVSA